MEKYHLHLYPIRHSTFNKFLHNKFNDLLLADSFRKFALSMISLFVPIFLYKIGFSVPAIIIFELIKFIFSLIAHYFILKHLYDWNVKRSLVFSNLLFIIFYLCLYNAEVLIGHTGQYAYLGLIVVINVLAFSIYWVARHLYFISTTRIVNSGRQCGKLRAIPCFLAIGGPFLGGLLITQFGFNITFLFCILFMAAASVTLFFSDNIKIKKPDLKIKKIFNFKQQRINFIYFAHGLIYSVTRLLWPLFMFFASIKIIGIGFLYLLTDTAHSISSYITGKKMDKYGNLYLAKIGTISHAITMICRPLLTSFLYMGTWLVCGGVTGAIHSTSLEGGFYKLAHKDMYNSIMNRELYMHLGRMTNMIMVIICLAFTGILKAFTIVIIIAGITELIMGLIIKKDKILIN